MNDMPRESWWTRNWKWFVPVGCMTTLLVFALGIAAMMYFVFGLLKSADVYVEAMQKARASSAVVAALGEPITEGLMPNGSIKTTGPSGEAQLAIPILGPKGEATVFLEARKSAGRWVFSTLEVELDADGRRIDLLQDAESLESDR